MARSVETLSRSRYIVITALGLLYLFFQTVSLSFLPKLTGLPEHWFNFTENIGVLLFLMTLLIGGWFYISVKRHSSDIRAALSDELVKSNMKQAAMFGFKIVFLLSAAIFSLVQFIEINSEDIARIWMTSCLVLPYLRFAWLEANNV